MRKIYEDLYARKPDDLLGQLLTLTVICTTSSGMMLGYTIYGGSVIIPFWFFLTVVSISGVPFIGMLVDYGIYQLVKAITRGDVELKKPLLAHILLPQHNFVDIFDFWVPILLVWNVLLIAASIITLITIFLLWKFLIIVSVIGGLLYGAFYVGRLLYDTHRIAKRGPWKE